MMRKILLGLLFAAVVTGGVFAETETEIEADTKMDFGAMPKNTITVDFGPTIIGAAIGAVGEIISGDEDGISSSGFGIAVQYERQLAEKLSVGGRFAYLGGGMGITMEETDSGVTLRAAFEMNLSSFSLEGHVRYYPLGGIFFVDGMLGYANMSAGFSGDLIVTEPITNTRETESISFTASRNYFKLGAKLGWRTHFGKPGGFTFEPSLGYYGGIGLGDTFGKQLSGAVDGDIYDIDDIDSVVSIIENFIFAGGPRLSLAFGWRF